MEDSNSDISYQINRQKIILIGDVAVGKTSIINTLLGAKFNDQYEPSIGVDFFSKTINYNKKQIKLQIWDSAGQEKFRSLIPNYIRGASLIFLIYDITNRESFEHLSDWINFINSIEKTNIVIVGNKNDLEPRRVISLDEGRKYAIENDCEIFEVSAKEGTGLKEMLFNSIADLPIFEILNNGEKTKEEIIATLKNENCEEYYERKRSNELDNLNYSEEKTEDKIQDINIFFDKNIDRRKKRLCCF